MLSSFLHNVCPSQLHFLLLICRSTGSWSVFGLKLLLLILSGTLTILHRHLMKTCSLFLVLYVNVQQWDACSKTVFTLELNMLTLVALPMILDFHRTDEDWVKCCMTLEGDGSRQTGKLYSLGTYISVTSYRPTYRFGLCAHLTLHCWPSHGHVPNWLDVLSLSQPHPSGALYLLTFNYARAFPYLSATWKPICSDWLSPSVLLQAPLYLRTSRRYRNVLLLLLYLIVI